MHTLNFELSFEVTNLTADAADSIESIYDAVFSTHGRTTVATLLVPGNSAADAASSAIAELRRVGVEALRLVDDLVTRAEIAERANVTTQAVGLWARGERNGSAQFPEPYVRAGSATLWLWGEVAEYLRSVGVAIDEGVEYPSRQDGLRIAALLAPEPTEARARIFTAVGLEVIATRSTIPLPSPRWPAAKYRATAVTQELAFRR